MAKILIKNGRVFNGEDFVFCDVLTDGRIITRIDQGITDNATFVYDAQGKTVSAGLVDIHVHLLLKASDEFGINGEMSCLPFGVTAVADAGRTSGERLILDSYILKNVVFVNADIKNNKVDFDKMNRAIERFGDKVVGVKVYFDTEVSDLTDITPLKDVCGYAKEHGLRVMVHCSNSPTPMSAILKTLNKGDILTHSFHGGKSNASEDDFLSMKEAQERGVIIDCGFAGHIHTDFKVFRNAIKSGIVPDTISTDITKYSAYTRGGRYGMTMCMSIARHMGMSEADIFKAVTVTPARVLGKEETWGTLKVGGTADIAVLEYTSEEFSLTDKAGNHIEDKNGYRCVLTVADGQIIYRD